MRKGVRMLIDEMTGKLGGYAVLLGYRYANLCVKAEAMSLLSVIVIDEEKDEYKLEDVAGVVLPNEYQFKIVPFDSKLIFHICKAIQQVHPEFKQDLVKPENAENEEDRHIICTMPEVNKDRRDALMNLVDLCYKDCDVQMKKAFATYQEKLVARMVGQPEPDIDEGKKAVEDAYNQHMDMVKAYKENKEKEIEEAYQKYLTEQQAKAQQQNEEEQARGEGVGQSLNINNLNKGE